MAEGEFWSETVQRLRKERRERLVGQLLAGFLARGARDRHEWLQVSFEWADAVIAESDRREEAGEYGEDEDAEPFEVPGGACGCVGPAHYHDEDAQP